MHRYMDVGIGIIAGHLCLQDIAIEMLAPQQRKEHWHQDQVQCSISVTRWSGRTGMFLIARPSLQLGVFNEAHGRTPDYYHLKHR